MIQVRDKKGTITRKNNDDSFIELTNSEGKLVAVFYENQDNGEIFQLMGDSPLAKNYEKLFNVSFINKQINYNKKDLQ